MAIGDPEALVLLPATRRDIALDAIRVTLFDAAVLVLVIVAGAVIAPVLGIARPLAVFGGAAIAALPAILVWKKLIASRLRSRGATRSISLTFVHIAFIAIAPVSASAAGLGESSALAMSLIGPLGFMLIGLGWQLRRGDSLHCPSCGHQIPPTGIRPSECSECGKPFGAVLLKGDRRPSAALIWIGVAIVALWMMPSVLGLTGLRSAFDRALPTPILIWTLKSQPAYKESTTGWAELTRRTLAGEQIDDLISSRLDTRIREGRLGFQSVTWIESMITAGLCGAAISERFFEEGILPALQLSPKSDQPGVVEWRLEAELRMLPLSGYWPFVAMERLEVDGVECVLPLSKHGAKSWIFGLYIARDLQNTGGDAPPTGFLSHLAPGIHRVRATILVAVVRAGTQPPPISQFESNLMSSSSGNAPPAPVVWWMRRNIEGEASVRP